MRSVEIGKMYRHFKGKKYLVLAIGKDVETLQENVIYKALYGDNEIWIRTKQDFLSEVGVRPKNDNITGQKYRFERCED